MDTEEEEMYGGHFSSSALIVYFTFFPGEYNLCVQVNLHYNCMVTKVPNSF